MTFTLDVKGTKVLFTGPSQDNHDVISVGLHFSEYAIYGHLTERVDVYSFGVVILEIISGRRSTDVKYEPVAKFLLEEAWNFYQQDNHLNQVDETSSLEEFTLEELRRKSLQDCSGASSHQLLHHHQCLVLSLCSPLIVLWMNSWSDGQHLLMQIGLLEWTPSLLVHW
ncbi:hypothetical protein Leryth_019759 [Lithospermum erythrorhizon]|nr:hypothetical protein Leryth_019759 [Lithospermum erythrorhizon]